MHYNDDSANYQQYTNLAYWAMRISKIDQQVITFQIKVHYILSVQVFHSKSRIHSNQEALPLVKTPASNVFYGLI